MKKLDYLKLINLLLNSKSFNIIFGILRFPFGIEKLKLLLIYFLPKFLIDIKLKYF